MATPQFSDRYTTSGELSQRAHDVAPEACDPVSKCIQDHPDASVLLALATGAACGVALGLLVGGGAPSPRSRTRAMAESVGERFMAAMDNVMPDVLAKTLHTRR